MIKIIPATRPLNHKLWKLLFLLAIWSGMELADSMAKDTTHLTQKESIGIPIAYVDTLPPKWPYFIAEPTQHLLDPKAREQRGYDLVQSIAAYNAAGERWNKEFTSYRTVYEVKPDKLLPIVYELKASLEKIQESLTHYDERAR